MYNQHNDDHNDDDNNDNINTSPWRRIRVGRQAP